ncbi:uncharacterized protein FA14DRAFT_47635 [Meira miltonrushii]|uniref:WW domain-containing protein n=1 Tax=Meira miltonrushii TaxID=1280837 RepID=A0A316VFI5_9BASI|nr:uncharacterized protein FA14DRAFT_47635 [Meira miltonrushii]PWN35828.1 hypothetical protein FA14DRAFT_47635 [Meira miltonrushii]
MYAVNHTLSYFISYLNPSPSSRSTNQSDNTVKMGLLDKLANKVQQPQRPPSYGGGQGGGYGGGPGGYGGGPGGYGGGQQQQSPYGQGSQGGPAFPSSPQPGNNYQSSGGSGQDSKGDDRPLPEGWVKQWDSNYNRHFYVDTRANPPRSIWVHPSDEGKSSQPPQQQFTAPSGPPPSDNRQGWGQGPPNNSHLMEADTVNNQ